MKRDENRDWLPKWARAVETPAFVVDLPTIDRSIAAWARVGRETGAQILYALKPLVQPDVLRRMNGRLDGFAASSLNEARLAREILGDGRPTLSITTPAYRPEEIEQIAALCDHVVLNSLGQWERFGEELRKNGASVGLRVNPGLSVVEDPRYDPCRIGSKLGVPLAALQAATEAGKLAGVEGLHFHTHADAFDFDSLAATVERITAALDSWLRSGNVRWINLGGGYPLPDDGNRAALYEAIRFLREQYRLAVFLEPGASLVREAGYLAATILDLFTSDDGLMVAVLDTSVNHAPEVFEYQFQPDALGHDDRYPYAVTLAGATCLSGDRFGVYRFAAPLRVGDKVIFAQMGAYAQPKAHWFNGVSLPAQYLVDANGEPHLRRRYGYADYRVLFGDAPALEGENGSC